MTPKEKALELVIKIQEEISIILARKIALICVDEVIDSHYKLLGGVKTSVYKYWQEVKEEINKL